MTGPLAPNEKSEVIRERVEKAREIHGDKYDYSKVEYTNAHTKVCIICPIHGEFWQKPYNHLQGRGCQECNKSHLEEEVENFLKNEKFSIGIKIENFNDSYNFLKNNFTVYKSNSEVSNKRIQIKENNSNVNENNPNESEILSRERLKNGLIGNPYELPKKLIEENVINIYKALNYMVLEPKILNFCYPTNKEESNEIPEQNEQQQYEEQENNQKTDIPSYLVHTPYMPLLVFDVDLLHLLL